MKSTTKKLLAIVLLSIALCFADNLMAQNARLTDNGNYTAITKKEVSKEAKKTGKTYTDVKGIVYDVYESVNGKLFYNKVSKTGNEYKIYLKLDN